MTQSISEAISLPSEPSWTYQDTAWMLGLYGTAIGAGTLFLPINAGLHGFLPLVIMALIAFPMTYFSHQGLCRFVLSGKSDHSDITEVVTDHFGLKWGRVITCLYFLTIYPILLMYSVALTNTTESFIIHQLHLSPLPRILLAPTLVLALMMIVHFGQNMIIRWMNILVYPFIGALLFLSFYLIPSWNSAILERAQETSTNAPGLFMTLWLVFPVMIFSFSHLPIVSTFAVTQKKRLAKKEDIDKHCSRILKYSHLLMVVTVMFFVFSCVFSLSPEDLLLAKKQNISILSYLANHFQSPLIAWFAPLIAMTAIAKSFLGHYLGAKEGLHHLISRSFKSYKFETSDSAILFMIEIFVMITCSITAIINPNILNIIEILGGPIIAFILFLMPVYAVCKVPVLKKYQNLPRDLFIVLSGLIGISAVLYGFLRFF